MEVKKVLENYVTPVSRKHVYYLFFLSNSNKLVCWFILVFLSALDHSKIFQGVYSVVLQTAKLCMAELTKYCEWVCLDRNRFSIRKDLKHEYPWINIRSHPFLLRFRVFLILSRWCTSSNISVSYFVGTILTSEPVAKTFLGPNASLVRVV